VIVEPALTNRDRAACEELAQPRDVARRIEVGSIVGMDAGRREDEAGIFRRALGGDRRRRE